MCLCARRLSGSAPVKSKAKSNKSVLVHLGEYYTINFPARAAEILPPENLLQKRVDGLADLRESADAVEARAKRGGAGASREVAEEVDVHLHGRERVLGRYVVVREALRELAAELEDIPEVLLEQTAGTLFACRPPGAGRLRISP